MSNLVWCILLIVSRSCMHEKLQHENTLNGLLPIDRWLDEDESERTHGSNDDKSQEREYSV